MQQVTRRRPKPPAFQLPQSNTGRVALGGADIFGFDRGELYASRWCPFRTPVTSILMAFVCLERPDSQR